MPASAPGWLDPGEQAGCGADHRREQRVQGIEGGGQSRVAETATTVMIPRLAPSTPPRPPSVADSLRNCSATWRRLAAQGARTVVSTMATWLVRYYEPATSLTLTRLQRYREQADFARDFIVDEASARAELAAATDLVTLIAAEIT